MKITKRQLRRIIKEEKVRFLREAVGTPPDPNLYDSYYDAVMDLVSDQFSGVDRFEPGTAESIAQALEDVANVVRNDAELVSGDLPPEGEQ